MDNLLRKLKMVTTWITRFFPSQLLDFVQVTREGEEAQHAAPAPQTLGKPREEAVCNTNPTPIYLTI